VLSKLTVHIKKDPFCGCCWWIRNLIL